jgi:hypothetical protein
VLASFDLSDDVKQVAYLHGSTDCMFCQDLASRFNTPFAHTSDSPEYCGPCRRVWPRQWLGRSL